MHNENRFNYFYNKHRFLFVQINAVSHFVHKAYNDKQDSLHDVLFI